MGMGVSADMSACLEQVHVVVRMQMVGDDIAGDPGTYDRYLHVDPSINLLSCSSAP